MNAKFTVEVKGRSVKINDLEYDFHTSSEWPAEIKHEKEALFRHVSYFLKARERYLEEVVDKKLNTD